MNIIEACKKAKYGIQYYSRYWRKSWDSRAPRANLTHEDILADDWEVEEIPVTIKMTKSEFWDLVQQCIFEACSQKSIIYEPRVTLEFFSNTAIGILAKKLGFSYEDV